MIRNKMYLTFEILALLVIAWVWGDMLQGAPKFSEHFTALQSAEDYGLRQAKLRAKEQVKDLRQDVRKQGNSREGRERIKRAEQLLEHTQQVVAFLEGVKRQLNKLPRNRVNDWMIEQKKAYEIKDTLDKYVKWMVKEYKDLTLPELNALAKSNKATPLYSKKESDKDFAHSYFENASKVEVKAFLSQKQLVVKQYEAEVLKKLGAGDLSSDLHPDVAGGVFVHQPLLQIPVGDHLIAEMVIKNFYGVTKANPRFFVNNTPIVVADRQGKVAFVANEVGKKHWQAKFILRIQGRDSIIIHQVPFEVLPKR
ncbi:hypothetical protein BKI52_28950 [marine bacterium AO1-C]|nr:hypothetical protein BKI52_28950 [marine bacterium AO1-C]